MVDKTKYITLSCSLFHRRVSKCHMPQIYTTANIKMANLTCPKNVIALQSAHHQHSCERYRTNRPLVISVWKYMHFLKVIFSIWLCGGGRQSIFSYISVGMVIVFEKQQDKTNKMICAHSDDSDQPEHPPSLITV